MTPESAGGASPPRRDFRADAVVYLIGRGVPAALQLVGIVLFARMLGPARFGVYTLVSAASFSFAEFFTQWAQQAMTRFYPRARLEGDLVGFHRAVTVVLAIQVAISATAAVAVAAGAVWFGLDAAVASFGVLLTLVTAVFNVLRAYFQATMEPRRWTNYSIANALARVALALALVAVVGVHVWAVLAGTAGGYLVVLPFMLVRIPVRQAVGAGTAAATVRAWWSYGWPLSGWSASLQVLVLADRYLIAWLRGTAQAGIYSSIYDLANRGLYPVADAVVLAVQPHVMRQDVDDQTRADLVTRSGRYVALFVVPIIAFSIVDGERLVRLLLGASYAGYYSILPLLLSGFLAWHLASCLQKPFEVAGRTRVIFLAVGTGACANLAANVPLIQRYGARGAALATLLSYLIYLGVIVASDVRGGIDRFPVISLVRVGIAAAAGAACITVVDHISGATGIVALAVGATVGAIVYPLALIVLREIEIPHPDRRRARLSPPAHVDR